MIFNTWVYALFLIVTVVTYWLLPVRARARLALLRSGFGASSARFTMAAAALLLCSQHAACDGRREQAALEAFAHRWRTLYDSHDVTGLAALYAAEGAYTAPGMLYFVRSRSELKSALDNLWRSNPELRVTAMDYLVVQDDRIGFAFELESRSPDRGLVKVHGATFLTVRSGTIVNQLSIMRR